MANLSTAARVQDAYAAVGSAWVGGPEKAYSRLARLVVDALPVPLAGRLVLDVGAGTGNASRWVARRGGQAVALDPATGMLAEVVRQRPPPGEPPHRQRPRGMAPLAVAGVAEALPFGATRFDAAVAAFALSHVANPTAALREIRRVLRPDGWFASIGFRSEPPHPAKASVDRAAHSFGFVPPEWYAALKEWEARVAEPDLVAQAASAAGFVDARVVERRVDTGIHYASDLVRWRLGMPHLAPFVAGLSPDARRRLHQEACNALGDQPPPWRPAVLILSSRTPA